MMQVLARKFIAVLQVVWQLRKLWRFINPLRLFLAGWSTPVDWATVPVPGVSDMNTQIRDNLLYLFSGRPSQSIKRDNGASYTTTSTTFINVDGTNLSITLTVSSGKVLVSFSCAVAVSAGANIVCFDVTVDGTRIGAAGADGLQGAQSSSASIAGANACVLVTGLSIGSHTFNLVWKMTAGTGTLYAGNGAGGSDFIPTFSVMEVG